MEIVYGGGFSEVCDYELCYFVGVLLKEYFYVFQCCSFCSFQFMNWFFFILVQLFCNFVVVGGVGVEECVVV